MPGPPSGRPSGSSGSICGTRALYVPTYIAVEPTGNLLASNYQGGSGSGVVRVTAATGGHSVVSVNGYLASGLQGA